MALPRFAAFLSNLAQAAHANCLDFKRERTTWRFYEWLGLDYRYIVKIPSRNGCCGAWSWGKKVPKDALLQGRINQKLDLCQNNKSVACSTCSTALLSGPFSWGRTCLSFTGHASSALEDQFGASRALMLPLPIQLPRKLWSSWELSEF